jgi:acyltransferase
MACLFSVELIHFVAGRYLKSDGALIAAAVVTYLSGYYLTLYVQFLPGPNFWFLHEALVVYSFYLVGVLLRRRGILMAPVQRLILVPVFVACALAVWFTFNLNTGPFRLFDAVVIVLSGHGHVFWFMFTALCGSMMLLVLANLCGRVGIFRFMGRNGLILFCLNGVFYHFFNGPFAGWFMKNYAATPFSVTLAGCLFTLVSLAACVPLVLLLERYVPQLVGRPAMRGPLLPALVKA